MICYQLIHTVSMVSINKQGLIVPFLDLQTAGYIKNVCVRSTNDDVAGKS